MLDYNYKDENASFLLIILYINSISMLNKYSETHEDPHTPARGACLNWLRAGVGYE